MRKSQIVTILSAVLLSTGLTMPVMAAEKKPICYMVCSCGYAMPVYNQGMSDEESAAWDAHCYAHAINGEECSFHTTDPSPNSTQTGNSSSSSSDKKPSTGSTSTDSSSSSSDKKPSTGSSQTDSSSSSSDKKPSTGSSQTGSSSSSSDKKPSTGSSSQTGSSSDKTDKTSGVLKGTGDTKDNKTYGKRQLTAVPTDYRTVSLTWNAVSGAKSYEIYYSTSPDGGFKRLTSTKKTSYRFKKAECGKTYYFQMRVKKTLATSSFGPISYAKTSLAGTPELKVTKSTYKSASLSWSKIAGAKKYKIYYRSSMNGSWQLLTTTSKTSYTHKKLTTGATYDYKVCPVRDTQKGSWSNSVSVETRLSDISGLKAKAATGKITLTWKKVAGAKQYVILRSSSKDGTYKEIGRSRKSSYADIGLKGGKTFYYKVYAVSGPYKTDETRPVAQTVKQSAKK